MSNSIKVLLQRRTFLKSQITQLTNVLDKGAPDNTTLKLRIARLTEVYNAYEEHNIELTVLDPDNQDSHQDEFVNVQERFFSLASRIDNILNVADVSNSAGSSIETRSDRAESTASTKKRRVKLPEAPLPTFDGKFENWLSFKNTFYNMIGSQTDLSDVDKMHYLKSALTGEAANKVRILEIDGISYSKAWELLERSYEVKRILATRHLSLIVNLPVLEKETTSGLTKLADDVQQHLASLATINVSVGPEMVVLEKMYEFLYKTAVCASRRERSKTLESEIKGEPSAKRRRIQASNQTFLSSASRTRINCVMCKDKRHPLFMCEKFKQLSVPKRIETVKKARLCYNCMRSHRDLPCRFASCTICQKRHNTLLHLNKFGTTGQSVSSSAQTANDTSA
ncbi:hypothetical protein ALC62_10933 [Cyphomyrmex costatus]|uniref:Uncharacterized protein n=1 Tax=Cyphomyrmex costatus TaxID=456900 RepID=A0A151ID73_9HYME|nr:hypothetical protein ALC62_10933 [Cyphomyrmex costatus]